MTILTLDSESLHASDLVSGKIKQIYCKLAKVRFSTPSEPQKLVFSFMFIKVFAYRRGARKLFKQVQFVKHLGTLGEPKGSQKEIRKTTRKDGAKNYGSWPIWGSFWGAIFVHFGCYEGADSFSLSRSLL